MQHKCVNFMACTYLWHAAIVLNITGYIFVCFFVATICCMADSLGPCAAKTQLWQLPKVKNKKKLCIFVNGRKRNIFVEFQGSFKLVQSDMIGKGGIWSSVFLLFFFLF